MRFVLLLLLAVPAAPQVAQEANREYLTKEGRERMGRNLAEAGRDGKEKPDEIVADMNIQPGMTVADIGSGVGYMLSRLSAATGPRGRVIAEDIFPDFLDKCRALAVDNKLSNIDFILGSEKDPRLPAASVDVALLLEVYHHFNYPAEMLAGLRESLKPEGRLFIVDFHRSYGEKHIRLDEDVVIREVESNGFHLVSKREHPSDNQYMAVFERNKAPVLPSKK
jgi:ubiquinone/menaquinone biosynthesis C-methylase UbiE